MNYLLRLAIWNFIEAEDVCSRFEYELREHYRNPQAFVDEFINHLEERGFKIVRDDKYQEAL